jgi:Flp pilus assembly protein CpaB
VQGDFGSLALRQKDQEQQETGGTHAHEYRPKDPSQENSVQVWMRKIASATRMPSAAAEMMPPA